MTPPAKVDVSWWFKFRGRRRLKYGWCPICCSSPPDPKCEVCKGSSDYGPSQTPATAEAWRARWERFLMMNASQPVKAGVHGRGRAPTRPPLPLRQRIPVPSATGKMAWVDGELVAAPPDRGPMPSRFEALAAYNAEVSRGIAHSAEYDQAMRELQAEFYVWSGVTAPASGPDVSPLILRDPIRAVQALQYTGANAEQWTVFLRDEEWTSNASGQLVVHSAWGKVTALPADWLLRTRRGLMVARPVLPPDVEG